MNSGDSMIPEAPSWGDIVNGLVQWVAGPGVVAGVVATAIVLHGWWSLLRDTARHTVRVGGAVSGFAGRIRARLRRYRNVRLIMASLLTIALLAVQTIWLFTVWALGTGLASGFYDGPIRWLTGGWFATMYAIVHLIILVIVYLKPTGDIATSLLYVVAFPAVAWAFIPTLVGFFWLFGVLFAEQPWENGGPLPFVGAMLAYVAFSAVALFSALAVASTWRIRPDEIPTDR